MLGYLLLSCFIIFYVCKGLNSTEFGIKAGDKIDICCSLIFDKSDSLYFSKGSITLGVLNNDILSDGDFPDFLKTHSDFGLVKRGNTICLLKNVSTVADDRLRLICKVTKDSFGRTMQQQELKIKLFEELKFLTVPPSVVNVSVGQPLLLQCEASGKPDLNVTWRSKSRAVLSSGAPLASLTIENVTKSMHGKNYTCKATISIPKDDPNASINYTVSLNVLYKPKFVMNVTSFQTDVGVMENIPITLQANPRPNLTCVWNRTTSDRTVLVSEPKPFTYVFQLEFDSIKKENIGKYECIAANSVGETIKGVSLKFGPVDLILVSSNSTAYSNYYLLEWEFLSKPKIDSIIIFIDVFEDDMNSKSTSTLLTNKDLSPKVVAVGNEWNNWKYRYSQDLMNLTSNKLHKIYVRTCSELRCGDSKKPIYLKVPENDGMNIKVLSNLQSVQATEDYSLKKGSTTTVSLVCLTGANILLLLLDAYL